MFILSEALLVLGNAEEGDVRAAMDPNWFGSIPNRVAFGVWDASDSKRALRTAEKVLRAAEFRRVARRARRT